MREILFRGQLRKKGEKVNMAREPLDGIWIYGGIFAANTNSDKCIITSYEDCEKYPVYADTVGQFTGLTDKNGSKIFEGDIVRYNGTNHEVVFESRGNHAYFGIVISPVETWDFGNSAPPYLMEIIGNRHDNPELIGGINT